MIANTNYLYKSGDLRFKPPDHRSCQVGSEILIADAGGGLWMALHKGFEIMPAWTGRDEQ